MSYLNDSDLEFLARCSDEDLEDLVYVLTHDKDGEDRYITGELASSEGYKAHYPHHHMYWRDIAAELQYYGANSLVSLFRNGGVLYKEILCDVCDKLDVNYNKNSQTDRIENQLLTTIFEKALDKMSPDDLIKIAKEIGVNNMTCITPEALAGFMIVIFNKGGFQSYQIAVTVANAVINAIFGRGLTFAGNAILTKTLNVLTGPVGWIITAIWTAFDIAGPAYRVTVPSVITVAALRQKALYAGGTGIVKK